MKVLFLIPVWQRPNIAIPCMEALKWEMKSAGKMGVQCEALYVVSEEWAMREADRHSARCVLRPNKPIGRKLNDALGVASAGEWDYVMGLGSDDLIRPGMWRYVLPWMQDGCAFGGFSTMYAYDSSTGRAKYARVPRQVIGAGRFISRTTVEAMDYRVWPDEASIHLDYGSQERIEEALMVSCQPIQTRYPVVCDVKSAVNLHSYDDIPGVEVSTEQVVGLFPALRRMNFLTDSPPLRL